MKTSTVIVTFVIIAVKNAMGLRISNALTATQGINRMKMTMTMMKMIMMMMIIIIIWVIIIREDAISIIAHYQHSIPNL